jgi:hypothetical protein
MARLPTEVERPSEVAGMARHGPWHDRPRRPYRTRSPEGGPPFQAGPSTRLNCLIVGSNEYPQERRKAMIALLHEAKVADPESKVVTATIPLRQKTR